MKKIIYIMLIFPIFLLANNANEDIIANIISNSLVDKNENDNKNQNESKVDILSIKENSKLTYSQLKDLEAQVLLDKNPDEIYHLAQLYINQNLFEQAYNLAMQDDTHSVQNSYIAGVLAERLGNYKVAIRKLTEVLSVDPDNMKAILNLGLTYRFIGENDLAIKYLTEYNNKNMSIEIINLINELKSNEE